MTTTELHLPKARRPSNPEPWIAGRRYVVGGDTSRALHAAPWVRMHVRGCWVACCEAKRVCCSESEPDRRAGWPLHRWSWCRGLEVGGFSMVETAAWNASREAFRSRSMATLLAGISRRRGRLSGARGADGGRNAGG
uniref:Uncharacterized protein n=1 Tax=Triticum urartu TaxID=4572 RepID=A0A8R7TDD0_TRIUA